MEMMLATREAVVQFLAATAGVTALVSPGSIFGERTPDGRTFPLVRVQPPSSVPFRMSQYNGEEINFSVSAFADGPSMDGACAIGGAIKEALDGAILTVDGETLAVTWTGGNVVVDGADPDRWHHFNSFTAS